MEAVVEAGLTEHWVSRPTDTPRSPRLHSSDSTRPRNRRPVVALVYTPAVLHTPGRDMGMDRAGSTKAQVLRQRPRPPRKRGQSNTHDGNGRGDGLVHESHRVRRQERQAPATAHPRAGA